MKKSTICIILCYLFLLPLFSCSGSADKFPEARVVRTINSDWTFNYFPSERADSTLASPIYDDSSWQAVALPHTWMTYETTGDIHPFIKSASERDDPYWWNGWGWYRKHFDISRSLEGKRIFLEFDGVQKYCLVYINGQLLGDHKGGYGGFYFELTPFLRYGEDNLIAVQVSNRRDDKFGTIPPATAGNFNVYGGIYRDVRLVVKNPIYIPFQGSYKHEGGTFVTTPFVSEDAAVYSVRTFVKNDGDISADISVLSTLVAPDGRVLEMLKSTRKIEPKEIASFDQISDTLASPLLWSPESPNLYHIRTEVRDSKGRLCDTYSSPLGFRFFRWDYDENCLYVNGKKIHIHGTNRHQEYPWLGDAVPRRLAVNDMDDIRYGLNTNFMRTAHYPQAPYIYDYNDQNGIITVEEVPNDKEIEFDRLVQEQNMREMVRRDRNHPSIFFWSVGNETSNAADSRWTHEEDTTRIIHERKTENYGDFVTHHAYNLDMENLLRVTIRGWTDTDVRNLEPKNEAGVSKSGQLAGTEEWQHTMARVTDGSIRGRIDGQVVCWLYADHGCDRIYKDAPLKNINYKGWVDMYRIPKYMYYLWQANYLNEPMVYIHPHYWQRKYLGQHRTIRVDSNCDSVELFAEDRSLGTLYPDGENFHTVEFKDVEIVSGTLRAVAKMGGRTCENEIRMAGEPYAIVLSSLFGSVPADRSGIDVITADVVDSQGIRVQGFTAPLTWSIEGEGSLVGNPIYVSDIDKNLADEGSGYVCTPVSNLVRSTSKAGMIKVKVTSPGLIGGEICIRSEKVKQGRREGISEPRLSDSGRRKVERDSTFHEAVEYVEEMRPIVAPEQFNASSREEYEREMRNFVITRNPDLDSESIEFDCLIDKLTTYIINTRGELTEDDYNFIARSFNDLRMISRDIENRHFHPAYTAELKKYYSESMLLKGRTQDVRTAIDFVNSIPNGLDVLYIRQPGRSSQASPIQYGNTTYRYSAVASSLEEAVTLLHPEFSSLSTDQRSRIISEISRINPSTVSDSEGRSFKYNKPIAIPRNLNRL